jgi:CheY-like chemotaxis protein
VAPSAAADIRPSLLVIDDDSRVRTVVCWQLEAEGYLVREAGAGNAACQPPDEQQRQPSPSAA